MRKILSIILVITFIGSITAQKNVTAQQIIDKAILNLINSKGLTASYTLEASGNVAKGLLKNSGTKFTVTMPDMQVWYNGKDMYTYNNRTGETTLTSPTTEELAEANPLLYIKNAKNSFVPVFSSQKVKDKYIIDLIPKNKRSDIKKITITFNSSNYLPEKIVGSSTSGESAKINITSLKTGLSIPNSEFEYPKSKYTKVEVIDLR